MKSKHNVTMSLPAPVLMLLDQITQEENRRKNDIITEAVLYWNAERLAAGATKHHHDKET